MQSSHVDSMAALAHKLLYLSSSLRTFTLKDSYFLETCDYEMILDTARSNMQLEMIACVSQQYSGQNKLTVNRDAWLCIWQYYIHVAGTSQKEIRIERRGKLTPSTSEALNIPLFYPDDHLCCHWPYLQKAGYRQELNTMILKWIFSMQYGYFSLCWCREEHRGCRFRKQWQGMNIYLISVLHEKWQQYSCP